MASFTLTVNIPASDKRAAEVYWANRGCEIAAQAVRAGGGSVTSGTILSDSAQNIGSWTYSPTAPS